MRKKNKKPIKINLTFKFPTFQAQPFKASLFFFILQIMLIGLLLFPPLFFPILTELSSRRETVEVGRKCVCVR